MNKVILSIIISISLFMGMCSFTVFAEDTGKALIPEGYATIDGVISNGEWDDAEKISVTQACTTDTKDKECNPEESSLSFRAMWDADYLYILIEIDDDQLVINENSGTSYRNDSIFLYVGEDISDHSSYGNSTYMICLFPYINENDYDTFNENGNTGKIICRNGAHDVSQDKYVCVTTGDTTNGYKCVMECAIMWDYFLPEVGESFAFDIQYNDSNSELYGSTSNNREAIWSWTAVGSDNKGPNAHLDLMGTLEIAAAKNPVNRPEGGENGGNQGDGNQTDNNDDTQSGNNTNDGENSDNQMSTTTTSSKNDTPSTEKPNDQNGEQGDTVTVVIIAVGAAVLVAAAVILTVVLLKRRNNKNK